MGLLDKMKEKAKNIAGEAVDKGKSAADAAVEKTKEQFKEDTIKKV